MSDVSAAAAEAEATAASTIRHVGRTNATAAGNCLFIASVLSLSHARKAMKRRLREMGGARKREQHAQTDAAAHCAQNRPRPASRLWRGGFCNAATNSLSQRPLSLSALRGFISASRPVRNGGKLASGPRKLLAGWQAAPYGA